MELVYIPVLYESRKGVDYDWYSGNYGIRHPYILISAGDTAYGVESLGKNIYRKLPGVKIFADSGGFQLQEEGVYISPERVAEWQDALGADIRFILDHPTILRDGVMTTQVPLHGDKFKEKLALTVDATKRMLNTYKTPGETYAVLHGLTPEEVTAWRDELLKLGDFAGWGISSTFKDIAQYRQKLRLLGEVGVKKIHVFGLTEPALLIHIARYMKENKIEYCSFDSTSYICTKFSSVHYPIMSTQVGWFARNEHRPNLRLVCDCPVCQKLNPNQSLDEGKDVDFGYKCGIHNIQKIVEMAKSIAELSKYDDLLSQLEVKYPANKEDSKIDKYKKALDYE
jgi:tRNA-guanine family transglycosylase